MRADTGRGQGVLATVIGLVVLLSGCSSGSASEEIDPVATGPGRLSGVEVSSYVALGDSFTAAPFVPSTDLAEGCFRSDGNYPALIADRLQPARFVDVSCSAATTEDLTSPQATAGGRGRVPPQLRAVTADTDLVTLGIGANDEDLFARLVALCAGPSADASCDDDLVVQTREVLRRTSDRVADALERLERRAPDATVVLIGYPRLVDADRPCARIPVPPESLPDLAAVEAELDRSLDRAAQRAGAAYVDMHALSRGHEICSSDPWVNGRRTDEQAALAYHPFAAGQGAVAERVLGFLREAAR